jgi:hypothetical protein
MKMYRFEEILCNTLLVVVTASVGAVFLFIPFSTYQSATVTQKALNEQCGTNYSLKDVLLAGEQLQDLCKMKNQELLLKQ